MMKSIAFALPLLALAACGQGGGNTIQAAAPAAAVKAPAGTQWSTTYAETADGGFRMGNPTAAIKLIEYGALSCPHCARFSKESREGLKPYIEKGTLSYELRTFLIHPQDVPATLLARCNGASSFFAMAEQMFDNQEGWLAKSTEITAADQQAWAAMPRGDAAAGMAEKLGLINFVRQRGVSADKAKTCLADPKGVATLDTIMKVADEQYKVTGTPTFILNGQVVPNTNTWTDLEPQLKAAGA